MRCCVNAKSVLSCLFFASILGSSVAGSAAGPHDVQSISRSSESGALAQARVAKNYGDLPLSFEANLGQADPVVSFLSRGNGYTFFLAPGQAVLSFSPDLNDSRATVLRMQLAGSNSASRISGRDPLPGASNYFFGKDPTLWRTGVPTYRKVAYESIYPGIDLVYYGNQRQLEYDFVVGPGADPHQIRLAVQGARNLTVDGDGNLVLHSSTGEV